MDDDEFTVLVFAESRIVNGNRFRVAGFYNTAVAGVAVDAMKEIWPEHDFDIEER